MREWKRRRPWLPVFMGSCGRFNSYTRIPPKRWGMRKPKINASTPPLLNEKNKLHWDNALQVTKNSVEKWLSEINAILDIFNCNYFAVKTHYLKLFFILRIIIVLNFEIFFNFHFAVYYACCIAKLIINAKCWDLHIKDVNIVHTKKFTKGNKYYYCRKYTDIITFFPYITNTLFFLINDWQLALVIEWVSLNFPR